jgi:hypothetical protein
MVTGRRGWRSRLASQRGAELIEFAVSLPVLLLIGLGIIDFGLLFRRYLVVTNAAREGARVAVLPGYGDADVVARINQYLVAGGLTGAHDAPVIVHPPPVLVGTNCAAVTSVTVTFPSQYVFVGPIVKYLAGATSLDTRNQVTSTAEMRNEVPASGCGP